MMVDKEPEDEYQKILCNICGWKYEYEISAFDPTVKAIYGRQERGAWSIGTKYILKEKPSDDRSPLEGKENLEFVGKNTTIPVPKIAMQWKDGKKCYTLMDRVPGKTLHQLRVDRYVPPDELDRYAQETAGYLDQLRKFTADNPSHLDGSPYKKQYFGGWGKKEEYFANWSGDQIQRKEAENLFPDTKPFTFSHLDIHSENVMIDNGHVSGIIDWEMGCYAPVWLEYLYLHETDGFGKRVAQHLEHQYPDVLKFRRRFQSLMEVDESKPLPPRKYWPTRFEGKVVNIPIGGDLAIYRGDRFIKAFLSGKPSDKENSWLVRVDLDKLSAN